MVTLVNPKFKIIEKDFYFFVFHIINVNMKALDSFVSSNKIITSTLNCNVKRLTSRMDIDILISLLTHPKTTLYGINSYLSHERVFLL